MRMVIEKFNLFCTNSISNTKCTPKIGYMNQAITPDFKLLELKAALKTLHSILPSALSMTVLTTIHLIINAMLLSTP